jgi:MoxR-like ATPase
MAKSKVDIWSVVDRILGVARTALLYGPPGTGKTFAAHGTDADSRTVYSVTITPDTPAAELRGHYVPVGGSFEWRDGPAIKAWREGARLVLNEIDHAGGDCVAFLLNCLDSPETARITLPTGESVKPAAGFQAVATMNGVPEHDLLAALRDRFPVAVAIEEPHPAAIEALPSDLQAAARGTVCATEPERRITLRSWLAFAAYRSEVGSEVAAFAIFGADRAADVLQSLAIAK